MATPWHAPKRLTTPRTAFCNKLVRVNLAMVRLPIAVGQHRSIPGSQWSWAKPSSTMDDIAHIAD
jgi:hypothetical protein